MLGDILRGFHHILHCRSLLKIQIGLWKLQKGVKIDSPKKPLMTLNTLGSPGVFFKSFKRVSKLSPLFSSSHARTVEAALKLGNCRGQNI